jgi:fatty-acyl-CoA synthase
VVQPAPGRSLSADTIIAGVREKHAGYKAPRRIVFVDEIPRAPNGKSDLARARTLVQSAQGAGVCGPATRDDST